MMRGDIYWVDLTPRSGSEQTGHRPALIVSNDGFNATQGWNSLIIIPLSTSVSQARRGITVVPVPAGTSGLTRDCYVLCHQITTIHRAKFGARIGTLPPTLLKDVEMALKAAIDLL